MYKVIRKKLAESVSEIDSPEHYDWNKWLRAPVSDDYYIEPLPSMFIDTSDIELSTTIPSVKEFSFDLPKIKLSKAFRQLNINKKKTNKIFFSFPKTNLNLIKEILPQAEINFSLVVSDSDKGFIFRVKDDKNKSVSELILEVFARDVILTLPEVSTIPLLLPGEKIISKDVDLKTNIEIYDLLENLKTEITNVELLNSDKFVDQIKNAENKEIKFLPLHKAAEVKKVEIVKLEKLLHVINDQKKIINQIEFPRLTSEQVPEISEIILPSVVNNVLKIMSVKNIKVSRAKIIKRTEIDKDIPAGINSFLFKSSKDEVISENQDVLSRDLELLLQPVVKFGKPEKEKIYNFLYEYQKAAADYLSENKFVLLNDELGTGKTLEIIGALKILFKRKYISNAVIVCRKEETGWKKRNPALQDEYLSGWYDHLSKYSPVISAEIIEDNSETEWEKTSAVKILSYQNFEEALEKEYLSLDDLNRRGCLVIDGIDEFPEIKFDVLPKYLWMLSGISSNELKDKIYSITGDEEPFSGFGRTKEELFDSLPVKTRQDYWIGMEPQQKLEYEKALESGREKIYDLVQAGNPFLVQSNVFTLIHQLLQIGNFYGKEESSPKSELLLHHVKTIQKSGKQVLVFTQYDKQGTQKLQKLFAKNGIKYVLYQAGISLKEMEDAIKRFAKDKSITVFLAGMKAINAKMNLANVPYLIHFDQWWSPAAIWQTEERINSVADKSVNERLNIYNYFIKNSIEEKIRLKLIEKGLYNKNLFDLLNSESIYALISNEDWLEILELIEPKDEASVKTMRDEHLQYVVDLSTDDFAHKIKGLIGRIGYKSVSFKTAYNPDEVRLYAVAAKNSGEVKAAVQCLNMKFVQKKIVKDFIESLVAGTDRIFIFTTGEFDEKMPSVINDERVVFIDKYQVSNYLFLFNLI